MNNVTLLQPRKPYTVNVSTLDQMLDHVDGNIVTLNIMDNGLPVMSNTVVFCHINESEFQEGVMMVESGGILYCYIAKERMDRYILTDVKQTTNGYDHHFIFTYRMGR